jgi:hypothetical protein
MMQLSSTVGVAPGTTTMTLGDSQMGPYCPPDEPWQYVTPPQVTEGNPPGVSPDVTQLPVPQFWDPYTDEPTLKGLRGLGTFTDDLSNANWSFVIFAGVAAFAIGFGVFYWKGFRKRKAS